MVKKLKTKADDNANTLTKISSDTDKRLRTLATANKVEYEEVFEHFGRAVSDGKDERTALYTVVNEYRRINQRKTFTSRNMKEVETVYGFIVGTRGLWDKAEQIRRAAKKFIDKNGMPLAIEKMYVNENNEILDSRTTIYGRPNPQYLKPLPPKLKILDLMLFGFFRHNGEKTFKWGSFQTSDNVIASAWDKSIVRENRYYTPCQVPAIIGEEQDNTLSLRSSNAKDTRSIFTGLKVDEKHWNIKDIIEDALDKQWTPIEDVEKHHEAHKNEWDRVIFVKGIVAWMNADRVDAIGRITIGIMDSEDEAKSVRVRIDPQTIDMDFGELSEVYIFGKTNRSMYKNKETDKLEEGDVVIDAVGIYATVKTPKVAGSMEAVDEEVVEGWLDNP